MKCTLRDRRSSLETISGYRADRASFSAAANPVGATVRFPLSQRCSWDVHVAVQGRYRPFDATPQAQGSAKSCLNPGDAVRRGQTVGPTSAEKDERAIR